MAKEMEPMFAKTDKKILMTEQEKKIVVLCLLYYYKIVDFRGRKREHWFLNKYGKLREVEIERGRRFRAGEGRG